MQSMYDTCVANNTLEIGRHKSPYSQELHNHDLATCMQSLDSFILSPRDEDCRWSIDSIIFSRALHRVVAAENEV